MNYFGSKNAANAYRAIINQMPPHEVFIEGFGGSAAVTFHKRPATHNYVIEIDPKLVAAAQSRLTARTEGKHFLVLKGDVLRWLGPDSWLRREIGGSSTLVYLDPPYLLSSRSSPQLRYAFEYHTPESHTALLKLARSLECRTIISHYRCPLYDQKLREWRRVDFRTGSRGGLKVESLYCNFPDPAVLHDYQYCGANKDRRQRLKRRISTLIKELAALPPVEAQAVVSAVAVAFDCA